MFQAMTVDEYYFYINPIQLDKARFTVSLPIMKKA
jgi:hypothetical protein